MKVPTKELIEHYLALKKQKTEAQRLVDAIDRQLNPVSDELKTYVAEAGGADKTTTRCGFILSMRFFRGGMPKWKDEFIKLADRHGENGAQAAIELQAQAPPIFQLHVEPVAP